MNNPHGLNLHPAMREWYERNVLPKPKPAMQTRTRDPDGTPKVRTAATDEDRRAIAALAMPKVNYPVGSFHKRFARDMQGATELTEGQRRTAWRMVLRYRRQIRDVELVNLAIRKVESFSEG